MDVAALLPFGSEVGYLGLILLSFFGSLAPFIPVPSFILLVTMSVGDTFNLHALAILSALAATAAKQIIFYVSYSGRRIMNKKTRKRIVPFQRLVKRYGATAVFVAAATPIPDDMVYVPLGLAKYDPRRFFISTLCGKLVLHYVIVILSHYLGLSIVETYLGDVVKATDVFIGIIIFGVGTTLAVVLLLRMDWARVLGRVAPWTLDYDDEDESRKSS
ncbi:MAG: DedA family protein [Cenarchaeum sp. SB0665_bin_23]|nr:DedA family protein [Cenarchaeum sp. SB0667_bin_13]MXY37994.1 DedA family protein [Cenarchaeum sp. SB0664_bin_35]MXY61555.1 DedA family protein [Cenarchaeum sp. SB0665_bin_23]MXZ94063.1 DedA family protein [Cenarchaeum sp. SB0666_bin_15]MYC79721.1 DedA family protein [Cenarchaeum sp. SB0661_bin_35]MYD59145.1 DedA family protein [Cenarchaeum sp. SB0678_bin_8]MYG32711.1 DedA family protein [Cenarchaeum sp. SB0677_bin_16]MYI51753.1 DedA family protein [Cenarchaeum sp. SB0673_bin_9]MYJ28131.